MRCLMALLEQGYFSKIYFNNDFHRKEMTSGDIEKTALNTGCRNSE